MTIRVQSQTGFLMPVAIFLLVILAGLGAYALNISSTQNNAAIQDVQSTRAYHAARAGVEWAAHQILQSATPADLVACPTTTLSLDGFSVVISCTLATPDATEQGGDHTIRIYEIASTATFGTLNAKNYIERRIDVTFSKCQDTSTTPASLCL